MILGFFKICIGTVLFFTGDYHQAIHGSFILKNNCYLSDVMFSFKDEERSH